MSLTGLTGVFSCGTLSLLGSLSKSGGVLWDFFGTVIPAAHSATNSSCWRWQRVTNAASPCTRNVTCSTFFPIQRTSWTIRTRCQGTKGKAAGQMRNSLLRKQRNRGALQEQVSPEFSSMICVLLSFKFRFKARLSDLRTQTVKLGKHAPRVHRGHSSADEMEVRSNLRVCLVQNLANAELGSLQL
jgi:hypothetical protein